jgi:hypothetical protein
VVSATSSVEPTVQPWSAIASATVKVCMAAGFATRSLGGNRPRPRGSTSGSTVRAFRTLRTHATTQPCGFPEDPGCMQPEIRGPEAWMERLWSLAVATGGNRWQIAYPRKPRNTAKIVATGCNQLPRSQNGKEGVDGSSPSEGLQKRRKSAVSRSGRLAPTRTCGGYGAVYGAFRSRPVVERDFEEHALVLVAAALLALGHAPS